MQEVLSQVALAVRDAVTIPSPAVRRAWALSMTQIEEGQLRWSDATQWALNHINSSQSGSAQQPGHFNSPEHTCETL